ncbi:MAG TPA: sulfurtransferase, partial [Gammaproteobacteria bacterium]|nr:sulfurtransferase [Gammaproteobacteria bacterium]
MTILNIAGYQFVSLQGLSELRVNLLEYARTLQLKGTILLSIEGINVALAGDDTAVKAFIRFL